MIFEQNRAAAAVFQAKLELRLRRQGHVRDADRAHNRLVDTVEASRHPNLLLDDLVRRLGRVQALNIDIDRHVVDLALANH